MPRRSREGRGREAARPRRTAKDRALRPEATALEGRALMSASAIEPTDYEQYMLELVNRARANPAAEAQWLLSVARTDPLVRAATRGWDLGAFAQAMSAFGPEPPLA